MKYFPNLSTGIRMFISFFALIVVFLQFFGGVGTDLQAASLSRIDTESSCGEIVGNEDIRNVKKQIVFIDSQVPDYSKLIDGVMPGIEVVLLHKKNSGITQICEALETRKNLDAIHIVTHGDEGKLLLAGQVFNIETIQDYLVEFTSIGNSLAQNGDMMLYGCNVAKGRKGFLFINALAKAVNADVAASNNLTGTASCNADWNLEGQTGTIDTHPPFVEEIKNRYDHVLAEVTKDFSDYPDDAPCADGTPCDNKTYDSFNFSSDDNGLYYSETFGNGGTACVYTTINATTVTIQKSPLSAFKFVSIRMDQWGGSSTVTVKGFRNSSEDYSQNITINGSFQLFTFNWENIDTITFSAAQLNIDIDDFSYDNTTLSVPTVTTTAISNITQTTADSGGNVTADGGASVTARGLCWFTSAEPTTANNTTSDGTGTGSFTSSMTGLTAGTTYYVRAYATNTAGTAYGSQVSFTTSSLAPSATTNDATFVSTTGTQLNGTVNANNESTIVTFEYGLTTGYGTTITADESPVTGTSNTSVSKSISGLSPNTTYHYRVVGSNGGGTTNGADVTFITTALSPPTISISGVNLNYTENNAATQVDAAATTNDADGDADWDGGTLTVQITANAEANDELSIPDNSVGNINTNGTDLRDSTTVIGTLSASEGTVTNNTTITITFNSSTTNTLVQQTLQAISYRSTSEDPGISNRTVTFTVTDKNSASANDTRTIAVSKADNDTPTLSTNSALTLNEGAVDTITSGSHLTATDVDDTDSELVFTITTETSNGVIRLNGLALSLNDTFTQADLNSGNVDYVHNDTNTTSDSFVFKVSDGTNELTGQTFNITVNAIDPPTVISSAASSIASTSTTIGGNAGSDGGTSITERGVVYSSSDSTPTIGEGGVTKDTNGTGTGSFSESISLLSPGTQYYFQAYATNAEGTTYGGVENFTTLGPPNTTTQEATAIGTTTATGNGNITDLGVPNPTEHGVCWSTSLSPTTADSKTTEGIKGVTGAFTSSITGLSAGTLYHYRAYATNDAGTSYGADVTFTTDPVAPTINTQAASSIAGTTATGNGNITDLGAPNPTEHGVCWSTSINPTTSDNKTTKGVAGSTGAFTNSITSLTPGTLYHYRAYATNMAGTVYGSDQTFTTLQTPVVTTQAASSVATTTATGNGNITNLGAPNPTEHGVCWSTSANPTTTDSKTTEGAAGSTGAFTSGMTSLSPGTLYHYRAYATNTAGTSYGADATYTTDPVAPTITTQAASSIAGTTATGNGNITDLGTPNPTEHGVCWGTSINPTTSDNKTTEGAAGSTGTFTSSITGLTPNTIYHYRTYATNTAGTSYGADGTFTTSALAPAATTNAASSVSTTGVKLKGTVNAYNASTTVTFEYGLTTAYGTTVTADESPVTGTSDTSVSKSITGLSPNTTYHYRVVGINGAGTTNGADGTFTTLTSVPTATTDAASSVSTTTAQLNGTVNANNASTTVTFEYGLTTAYGTTLTADESPVSGITNTLVSKPITGLSPNFTYHYRVVGINSGGTTNGSDQTFTTSTSDQNITFNSISEKQYGDAPFGLNATASSGLAVAYTSSDTGVAELNGSTVILVSAGSVTITASQAGNSSYNAAVSVEQELVVQKAVLTVTANGQTRYYNEENPLLTISYNGWVNSENEDNLTISATAVTPAIISSEIGNYAITPSGAASDNYTFHYVNSVLSVVPLSQQAMAILANTPSSLTSNRDYAVSVGGIGVLNYKFKVDYDNWSDRIDVNDAIVFSVTDDGSHELLVIGEDSTGSWQEVESATRSNWIVDTIAPDANIQNAPQGVIGATSINIGVNGDGVQFYKYLLGDGELSLAISVTKNILVYDIPEGEHTLSVIGMDTAGNWQDVATTVSWAVDLSVPTAALSDLPGSIVDSASTEITVMGDGVSGYRYRITGPAAVYDGTWSGEITIDQKIEFSVESDGTDDGEYTLNVNAKNDLGIWQDGNYGDTSGNATVYTWTVDTTNPVSVGTLTTSTGNPVSTAVKLSWPAVENGLLGYRLWYSETEFNESTLDTATEVHCGTIPGPESYMESFQMNFLNDNTGYYFAVKSVDAAGNISDLSNVTLRATADLRPVISDFLLDSGDTLADNGEARTLTVTGLNFMSYEGDNIVRFVNPVTVFDVVTKEGNESSIDVDVPVGSPVGEYSLRVINKNGSSLLSEKKYTVTAAPVPVPEVTNVEPLIGGNDAEISITITGGNFAEGLTKVSFGDGNGTWVSDLTNASWMSSNEVTATVPAGLSEGQYSIQVVNPNGDYNWISSVEFEVSQTVDMSVASGSIETPKTVQMPSEGVVPYVTVLTTDNRPEIDIVKDNNMGIDVTIEPGTSISLEDGTPYTGVLNPPRQIYMTDELASELEENQGSDTSHAVVFSVGSTSETLQFGAGQTVYVEVEFILPTTEYLPSIYYYGHDGSLTLAGVDGEKNGFTLSAGGTLMSELTDSPEPGYTAYTFGLLLDHMSTYVAAVVTPESEILNNDDESTSGSGGGGACFVNTSAGDIMSGLAIIILFTVFSGLMAILILNRKRCHKLY